MAKKFLDIEISRSKKNKQTSQFHLYRQNLLEDRNAQRRLFFDFISICIKELEKNNLLKHRYSNYFMKKIKI
jgi:hypothetical protein